MGSIARTVTRRGLDEPYGDQNHWRDRPPAERVAAVETLRRDHHDGPITMHLSRDFSEFIAFLFDRNVRFLVVGGYAVAAHRTDADFLSPGRVVQLGYPPLRIDLLTSGDGVALAECYDRRADVTLDGQRVPASDFPNYAATRPLPDVRSKT